MSESTQNNPPIPRVAYAWLAGLLEGEGTFLLSGGKLRLRVVMTDEDVIARAASITSTRVKRFSKREVHHKTPFCTELCGDAARDVMKIILPLMGKRRTAQIQHILDSRDANVVRQKQAALSRAQHRDIELLSQWNNRPAGQSERAFFEHCTVYKRRSGAGRLRQLLSGYLPTDQPQLDTPIPSSSPFEDGLSSLTSEEKLAWVAGLLEGEGCFGLAGKSTPRVTLAMTDQDVVERFAEHANTTVRQRVPARTTWKVMYLAEKKGIAAESLMRQLLPLLGIRRAERVREILAVRETLSTWAKVEEGGRIKRYFGPPNHLQRLTDSALIQRWRAHQGSARSLARELDVDVRVLINTLIRLGCYERELSQGYRLTCQVCGNSFWRARAFERLTCSTRCYKLRRRSSQTVST